MGQDSQSHTYSCLKCIPLYNKHLRRVYKGGGVTALNAENRILALLMHVYFKLPACLQYVSTIVIFRRS